MIGTFSWRWQGGIEVCSGYCDWSNCKTIIYWYRTGLVSFCFGLVQVEVLSGLSIAPVQSKWVMETLVNYVHCHSSPLKASVFLSLIKIIQILELIYRVWSFKILKIMKSVLFLSPQPMWCPFVWILCWLGHLYNAKISWRTFQVCIILGSTLNESRTGLFRSVDFWDSGQIRFSVQCRGQLA